MGGWREKNKWYLWRPIPQHTFMCAKVCWHGSEFDREHLGCCFCLYIGWGQRTKGVCAGMHGEGCGVCALRETGSERRNAEILSGEESLMHVPCSCFLKGDKNLCPLLLLPPPKACRGTEGEQGSDTDPCPSASAHSIIAAVWKNNWGGGSRLAGERGSLNPTARCSTSTYSRDAQWALRRQPSFPHLDAAAGGKHLATNPPLSTVRLVTWTRREQQWLKFPPLLLGIWGKKLKISTMPLPAAQKTQTFSYIHRVL